MVRQKNRYMVIEVNTADRKETSIKLKEASLYEAIMKKVQQLHGDFGIAAIRAGFTAKYINEPTRIAIIRTRRGPHRLVASALPFIQNVDDKSVIVRTLYTGATIRQCFFFIKNYQQEKFDEYCKNLRTDEEKIALQKMMQGFETVLLNL